MLAFIYLQCFESAAPAVKSAPDLAKALRLPQSMHLTLPSSGSATKHVPDLAKCWFCHTICTSPCESAAPAAKFVVTSHVRANAVCTTCVRVLSAGPLTQSTPELQKCCACRAIWTDGRSAAPVTRSDSPSSVRCTGSVLAKGCPFSRFLFPRHSHACFLAFIFSSSGLRAELPFVLCPQLLPFVLCPQCGSSKRPLTSLLL